jgi:hypothetical protein
LEWIINEGVLLVHADGGWREATAREAATVIEPIRRDVESLLSYLKGISRQTAEMVKAHNL